MDMKTILTQELTLRDCNFHFGSGDHFHFRCENVHVLLHVDGEQEAELTASDSDDVSPRTSFGSWFSLPNVEQSGGSHLMKKNDAVVAASDFHDVVS